jgi:CO dehydrogenase maturation factor
MKIAFVGKGGSGKSTVAALFIRYLQAKARDTLAIDADINMNLSGLLGVHCPSERFLSSPEVAASIRTHLKGANSRIPDIKMFLPTTPPGPGSNVISHIHDSVIEDYALPIDAHTQLLTVGTYETSGIGQTCYHSHLFVAENLLSHMLAEKFDVVCDMVAGTDSFAYSMYVQFDCIVLLTEPTPESVAVSKLYLNLAKSAGIETIVQVVANKVENSEDLAFIAEHTGVSALGTIDFMPQLKRMRQRGHAIPAQTLTNELHQLMDRIYTLASAPRISPKQRQVMLRRLHQRLNEKEWVKLSYGDVSNQIDQNFFLANEAP